MVRDGETEKARGEITGKRHYVRVVYLGFETIEKNRCDDGGVDKISTITTSKGSIAAASMQGRGRERLEKAGRNGMSNDTAGGYPIKGSGDSGRKVGACRGWMI